MRSLLKQLMSQARLPVILAAVFLGLVLGICAPLALHVEAQVYTGGGIQDGVNQAASIAGVSTQTSIKTIIIDTVHIVLSFLALVAVIVIIIAGIILVTSQGDDSKKETCKKAILYAIVGLIIILVSEGIVILFTSGVPNAGILGGTNNVVGNQDLRATIIQIVRIVLSFLALVAVIVIIIAAIILITSVGDEAKKETCKKAILYALVGLVIILLSEAVVRLFVTDVPNGSILGDTGGIVGNQDVRSTVLNILFLVLRFLALVAVIVIVIAGIYLVVSLGDEQAKEKAKKIILYTIVGLIIILLAEALVRIVVDAGQN